MQRSTLVGFAVLGIVFVGIAVGGLIALKRLVPLDTRGAKPVRFTVSSLLLHRDLSEIAIAPKGGGKGRPVLVLLPGRSSRPSDFLSNDLFRNLADLGDRAPDVILVDGGDHSYYHDRADGPWGRFVLEEAITAGVTHLRADPTRIAIAGVGMGGYGALDLAIEHPGLFCAVGAGSAELWATPAEASSGAFDDAQDFARHDVLAVARSRARAFGKTRVWIGVGRTDPFRAAGAQLVASLRANGQPVRYLVGSGTDALTTFWALAPDAFPFYANALADCR